MITIVVTLNILLSVVLLYVACRVWLLKRSFARINNVLNKATINTHAVLGPAPNFISTRQARIKNLRSRNRGLESQFKKAAQLLSLLLIISRWRQGTLVPITKKSKIEKKV